MLLGAVLLILRILGGFLVRIEMFVAASLNVRQAGLAMHRQPKLTTW